MVFIAPETESRLRKFQNFFEKWNGKINLMARDEDIWNRHILDSLQLIDHVPHETELVDVGTGGGFPGIILAIAGIKKIHLVESDRRKCQFLEEAKIKFSLDDCYVYNSRIENLKIDGVKIITSRAFSAIDTILESTSRIRNSDTIYFLHKTEFSNKELDTANKKWSFHVEQLPSVTSPTHCILKLYGVTSHGQVKS